MTISPPPDPALTEVLENAMPADRGRLRWLIIVAATLLTCTILFHPWIHDDTNIVSSDTRLHTIGSLFRAFRQPYWPPPFSPDLYRPISSVLFALEWMAGQGNTTPSRIVSIVLFASLCLVIFRLLQRVSVTSVALVATFYFLVQPVHAEAVAEVVNQSELLVAILGVLIVERYLIARTRGLPSLTDIAVMLGFYIIACGTKESGVTLVGLVVAAELFLVQDRARLLVRVRALAPLVIAQLGIAIAFITVRTSILHSASGTFTAEALRGLDMKQRVLTMLPVVTRWLTLLTWPTHQQIDYSPREINPATTWGVDQSIGAAILLVAVLAFAWSAFRRPRMAFGLSWIAIGLFPVSNILVPTGIVLAERTMLLPSIGVLFLLLPLIEVVMAWGTPIRSRRLILAGVGLVVIVDGASRVVARLRSYRNLGVFWLQAVADAPESYRASMGLGQLLWHTGKRGSGEAMIRRAITLDPESLLPYLTLGDLYRMAGSCTAAIPLYAEGVRLEPTASNMRASMIACMLYDGRYEDAKKSATDAFSYPVDRGAFRQFVNTADSAIRVGAPPQSVRITIPDSLSSDRIHP